MIKYKLSNLTHDIRQSIRGGDTQRVTLLLTLLGRIKYDRAVATYESLKTAYAAVRDTAPEDSVAEDMVHEVYQNLLHMVADDVRRARGKQHLKKVRIETALDLGLINAEDATMLYTLRSKRLTDLSITVSQDQINALTDDILNDYIVKPDVKVEIIAPVVQPDFQEVAAL